MTVEEAKKSIEAIREAELYGWGFVRSLGPEKVAAACNGCGPDSWRQEWRDRLGRWLKTFKLAFDGHDCRHAYDNDGSREKWEYANNELEKNCILLADRKYAWYNPIRYVARKKGRLAADACRTVFGWSAWQDSYNKNKNKEKTT